MVKFIEEHFADCPRMEDFRDYHPECKGVVKRNPNEPGLVEANLVMDVLGRERVESLFDRGLISPCCFMVKRDAIVKRGYFFLDQDFNEDYGLILEGPGLD